MKINVRKEIEAEQREMNEIIVFDTNFLVAKYQFKLGFAELDERFPGNEKVVLEPCVEELKKMASGKGADAMHAKSALADAKKMRIAKSAEKSADNAIVAFVENHESVVVCTNDSELRKRVKEKGGKIAFMRGKKRIEVE